MSDAEKSPLDLTGLDFGPAWAKDKTPARDYSKEVGPRENRDRRGNGPRRDGGSGQNDRRKSNDRRQNNDRRNDQRGDRRRNDRRGGDRRDQYREPRVEVPAPEGFNGGVMPVEEGLDNLSKEIQGGGRTYSVFDLARVVMGARERFNVTFEAPKGTKFFRCKSDGSLWLTKAEAVSHFWQADLLSELYEQVETEVDAPKGNFTSVAKCGLSGKWLAPPNYHSYPTAVAQMHAERYAHMSLEDYKRKIRVENGEEVVAAWMETQTKKTQFRPLSTQEILDLRAERKAAEEKAKEESKKEASSEADSSPEPTNESKESKEPTPETEETPTEATTEVPVEPAITEEAPEEAPTEEAAAESEEAAAEATETPSEEAEETPPSEEETPAAKEDEPAPEVQLFESRRDVERHFADHHFKHIFAQVDRAWVPGNVSAKLLSPALLTLLKATVADERRYPSKLTPILCRQLSGRHLAVFKWKKKLKAGPARPHAVPEDIQLAERPQKMLAWITENSGKNLEDLWKGTLPENTDENTKRSYYHDLHWLLNQGFVLLMADSTLHLAKAKAVETPKKENKEKVAPKEETKANPKAEEAAKTTETKTEETEATQAPTPAPEETQVEEPADEEPKAETPSPEESEEPKSPEAS